MCRCVQQNKVALLIDLVGAGSRATVRPEETAGLPDPGGGDARPQRPPGSDREKPQPHPLNGEREKGNVGGTAVKLVICSLRIMADTMEEGGIVG